MNIGTQAQAFEDTDELPPDTSLLGGRIVLDLRIGRGGAATVYAATTADGHDVAVKIMSAAYADLPTARQRFRNEVVLAQHLAGHPRVVVPYEMGELPELGGRLFMTMPLVKGRSLLLRMGRMPLLEAVALLRDIARILADVHERGIVHRDVKPGNVLVRDQDGEPVPYLIDFGLAYSSGEGTAPTTAGLTAAHELPGTKHYMAPEQILGATPDPRFDVYALGVTMIEVLTGVLPLHDLSPADAARRKCDPSLPSLSIVGKLPGLPRELEQAIDAALERDPEQRTPSAAMVAEQLARVIDQLGERPQPQAVPVVPKVPERTQPQAIPPQELPAGLEEHRVRQAAAELEQAEARPAALREVEPERAAAQRSSVGIPVVGTPPRTGGRASKRWAPLAVAATAMVAVVGLGAASFMDGGLGQGSGSEQDSALSAAGIAASGAGVLDAGGTAEAVDEPGDGAGASTVQPEDERLDVPKPAPAIEPEPDPAIEAEPVEVPEPAVEPEPTPPPKSDEPGKVKKPRQPRPPELVEPPCADVTAEATTATRSKQWSRVLKLTKAPRCWDDDVMRNRLRVNALFELGRYVECVKLGEAVAHPEVQRRAKRCEQQLEKDGAP